MYKNNVIASSMGTLVEWAEFSFYGYLIIPFSHLFFSMLTPDLAILATFGGFAVSYLARPLGSFLFGHIGDKKGRQKALSSSLFIMSLATLGIGILPTAQTIGIYAPALLLLLRFLQGLSMGGEYTGAAVFIIEHDSQRPYLSSCWVATAAAAGMLVGGAAAVIISLPAMPEWAWRIPFYLGAGAGLIGFYIRRNLSETTPFKNLVTTHSLAPLPIKTVMSQYKRPLLQTAALGIFIALYIYIFNVWWITYVIKAQYFSALEARFLASFAQACVMILTPVMALTAERWNGKALMKSGLSGSLLIGPGLFLASVHQQFYLVMLINIFYALFLAAVTATMFKYFADIFPSPVRCTGQAIGYNIGVAIFGGSAPLLAQILSFHHLTFIAVIYVMISTLIALFSIRINNLNRSFMFVDDSERGEFVGMKVGSAQNMVNINVANDFGVGDK